MRRYASHVEVMGKGRYRVTVKSKHWWQRRWRITMYSSITATTWEETYRPGVLVPTALAWWLTDRVLNFMVQSREASYAAR